jgi:hypothetical protein
MNKARINEVTGNPEIAIGFKFKSISETVLKNSNGKEYRIVTGTVTDKDGKEKLVSGAMYQKNYSKATLAEGDTLLAVASKVGDQVYIQVSHLPFGGERATVDMFDFAVETPIATTSASAATTAAVESAVA